VRYIGTGVASIRRWLVWVGTWLAAQMPLMRDQRIPATAAAQALRRQYALGAIGRQAFDRSVARLARRRR